MRPSRDLNGPTWNEYARDEIEGWPSAQRRSVGEGLLRLDDDRTNRIGGESLDNQTTFSMSSGEAGNLTPGGALSRLIAHMAARRTTMEATDEQPLRRRAEDMRKGARFAEQDVYFYTNVHLMNVISHAIEEQVITRRLPCEVYAGFQRLALLRPQLPRYQALLQEARHVLVYGIDDVAPGSPVAALRHPRFIRFAITPPSTTQLEWFWFVVVDTPQLSTALVAQHTGGDIWAPTQTARMYRGFWIFDASIVGYVVEVLRQAGQMLYRLQG